MDKKLFAELVESVKEMMLIRKGEIKAARVTHVGRGIAPPEPWPEPCGTVEPVLKNKQSKWTCPYCNRGPEGDENV